MEIKLKDGRLLTKHVEHAIGSVDRPMSDAQLEANFRGLCEGKLTPSQTDRLISLCWSTATLDVAGALARATIP